MDVKTVSIKAIKPYENNPRKNDSAVSEVAKSIKEFGFQQPIVVDSEGTIIVGHTRFKAAQSLGLESVPVLYIENLTPEQIKAYRIADNKTNEFASWDASMLATEFSDLKILGYDLTYTGFKAHEIEQALPRTVEEDNFDVEGALADIKKPTSQRKELIQLGRHRLFCGDASDPSDVAKLMEGVQADLIFTDIPYNTNYTGGARQTRKKIKNDNLPAEAYTEMIRNAFINMQNHLKTGSSIYVCHSEWEGLHVRTAFLDAGFDMRQCLIWVKNVFTLNRQDYQWQHEPILYGWKEGAPHKWYGGRKMGTAIIPENGIAITKLDAKTSQITVTQGLQKLVVTVKDYMIQDFTDHAGSTIWYADKPIKSEGFPTMKPVKLCARAIVNSSIENEVVLDPFGGSGSTLIACEQLNRSCYIMDVDPICCDIIIKRWEEYGRTKTNT